MSKITKPFGLWDSPVSAEMVARQNRLENPQFDSDGLTLAWLENRSGRGVVVATSGGGAVRELTLEPVSGGVGYGGGEYHLASGRLVFAARDGRLYTRRLSAESPVPLTPPFGSSAAPSARGGTAAPALSPDGRWVLYIFSDGKDDVLALVDTEGEAWPVKLASGADFYMHPAWHPSVEQIAWVEWDQPNMPWDGTRLMLGRLGGLPEAPSARPLSGVLREGGAAPRLVERRQVAGDEQTTANQPQFSPDGRWLGFLVASGEFEDLVLLDLESGEQRVLVHGDSFHLCDPDWIQGLRSWGWSHTAQKIYHIRNFGGSYTLWTVDVKSSHCQQIDTAPYTWLADLSVSPARDEVAFVASAPSIPDRIVRWDGRALQVEAYSSPEMIDPGYLPVPQDISWPAPDGMTVHGWFYPPTNPDFTFQGLPPALVRIHGGPTSQSSLRFNAETAYNTSRGWAVLQVNYRGSTGCGRSFRNALRFRWGEADVEDALGAARALTEQKLADPHKLVIAGGSAGGYTVLNTLIRHPGVFRAGLDLFGVSKQFAFDLETHKFEARQNERMIGPLPEAAARYYEWSPLNHADAIRDPLAVFQGAEDRVVPPSHSEDIVAALRRNNVPHIYRLYEGEGHGFRKAETITDYLEQAGKFLIQHVLMAG